MTAVLEGSAFMEGDYIDGSAELLEGIVDEEELADLSNHALEAARARRARKRPQ